MSLAAWIGAGAAGGVLTGIFAGDACKVLQPVGSAYVMLLESVVYPYLISSLLHGLGRLSPKVALRLLKKSWPFYLAAWGGTLGVIYLLSQAFPAAPRRRWWWTPRAPGPGGARTCCSLILPGNIFQRPGQQLRARGGDALGALRGGHPGHPESKERVLGHPGLWCATACVKIWKLGGHAGPGGGVRHVRGDRGHHRAWLEAGGLVVYVGLAS